MAERLAGPADVVGPADNCRFALYTLMRLDVWLAECGAPAVVHWNNGLWDLGRCPSRRPEQVPLADYLGNLGFILARLQQTGARVLWRNTTPVSPTRGWRDGWLFTPEDVRRYNAEAAALMQRAGVPVHDLHAVVAGEAERCLAADGVHLSPYGQERCAASVADTVRAQLGA